jgi:hypothetical protein
VLIRLMAVLSVLALFPCHSAWKIDPLSWGIGVQN